MTSGIVKCVLVVVIVVASSIAMGRPGVGEGDVERRIADFWKRVDAMAAGDHLSSADLGQWALNVIDRDARARITVADFRASTAAMQVALERARIAPANVFLPSIEQRIADFWKRVDTMTAGDHLSSGDLGQWALNVIERDATARITVADFRASTGAMQAAFERAGPASLAATYRPARSLRVTAALKLLAGLEIGGPYPSIAAGPSSLVLTTHPTTAIYTKAGVRIAGLGTSDLFRPVMPPDTTAIDPRVMFDERSGRFFLTAAAQGACQVGQSCTTWMIAVSRSSAPTSMSGADWSVYGFDGSLENGIQTSRKGDFNLVGLTDDKLALVGIAIGAAQAYPKVMVFDPKPFLDGHPVAKPLQQFQALRDANGVLLEKVFPAIAFGPTPTAFLVSWIPGSCDIAVAGVSGTGSAAQIKVQNAKTTRKDCVGPTEVPQLGGGAPLDAFPQITTPPVFRDGHLWLVQSVLAGADAAVRLVEIDVSRWPDAPTTVSDATFSEPGISYFDPAVTVDAAHNVAIVTHRSSEREYGSLWLTGRRAEDARGTFRPAVPIKHGEANWSWSTLIGGRLRNAFGPWSSAAIDPVDGSAWFVGQATRTACEWEIWAGRTDFGAMGTAVGTLPVAPPTPVRATSCRDTPEAGGDGGEVTVRFIEQRPTGLSPSGWDIAVVFEIRGISGWPGQFVIEPPIYGGSGEAGGRYVFSMDGKLAPGEHTLVMRLPDGREVTAPFTVR